jgi:hypothetical protein
VGDLTGISGQLGDVLFLYRRSENGCDLFGDVHWSFARWPSPMWMVTGHLLQPLIFKAMTSVIGQLTRIRGFIAFCDILGEMNMPSPAVAA